MNTQKLFSIAILPSALAGCAESNPVPQVDTAWITMQAEAEGNIRAETLDGKPIQNGESFLVSPGKHTLGLQAFLDDSVDVDDETCQTTMLYSKFKPNEHYVIRETNTELNTHVQLTDSTGKVLLAADLKKCHFG